MDISHPLKLLAISLAFSLLVGCAAASDSPLPAPGRSESTLRPYVPATDAAPVSPTAVSATDMPIPSPTPSTYKVVSGDSLGTIAEHFGLRLAELQAANPGVVSESLAVGQKLNIPAANSAENALPTPAPAQVGAVTCYPSGGGSYCIAAVRNPFPDALENVKVQMTLLGADGRALNSLEAFLPLNILPPGSELPAYAYFSAPAAQATPAGPPQASAQLAVAIRLLPGDERYLPAVARNVLVSVAWDGRSARAQGQVFLSASSAAAKTLWLAGVAYSADGQIVGFRRWEWQGSLQAGSAQAFDFSVYSLGPAIERVEIIVEARP